MKVIILKTLIESNISKSDNEFVQNVIDNITEERKTKTDKNLIKKSK